MITYLSRALRPIPQGQWAKLFRDPAYTTLAKLSTPGLYLEACWVGLTSSMEATPKPFLVQGQAKRPTGKPIPLVPPMWYATEERALEAFEVAKQHLLETAS